jgi:hypothetical protein
MAEVTALLRRTNQLLEAMPARTGVGFAKALNGAARGALR